LAEAYPYYQRRSGHGRFGSWVTAWSHGLAIGACGLEGGREAVQHYAVGSVAGLVVALDLLAQGQGSTVAGYGEAAGGLLAFLVGVSLTAIVVEHALGGAVFVIHVQSQLLHRFFAHVLHHGLHGHHGPGPDEEWNAREVGRGPDFL
jgi:hypothetical protein